MCDACFDTLDVRIGRRRVTAVDQNLGPGIGADVVGVEAGIQHVRREDVNVARSENATAENVDRILLQVDTHLVIEHQPRSTHLAGVIANL